MEGVLQDVLRQFKKGCEEVTCEYFAAMKRMEDKLCSRLPACDSDSALEVHQVDGMRPQPVVAKLVLEGLMECLGENQRKMTKFFEDGMSALVSAAAPILEPLTASIKPAGKDERKTAEAAAPTSANKAVGYSAVFVGRVPRSLANSELQKIFDTEAIPVRYHGKGKHGFAKLLVRNSEIVKYIGLNKVRNECKDQCCFNSECGNMN